ncbi:ERMES complex subunit MDM12 [Aspergillus glaucus CBS 516.65]|uniref:Mitochondrial distribution and morphology protein 12 n=1 Tax=Aspergillus glaucus CBS 516.65 TaxID=1160497 RepID=A0A1L9VUR4_ASPGL|nr:hypothetical protein ASPGLDRAFT_118623 [Aspergillus glaucus CBS 516.65]OJJ87640.1 hypothetical protein ASPGLDRAFT_118623 [Aspergillus glaucus CBS 516.65]
MSIDVNWETATSGPDGEALAERIRSFIHDKFQQVALPRFIRSVHVHSFDFGTIPPDLEIKDFCEPFTDFYEEDDDDEISEVSEELVSEHGSNTTHDDDSQWPGTGPPSFHDGMAMNNQQLRDPFDEPGHHYDYPSALRSPIEHLNSHFLPRAAGTPGLPVGTSTLGYHLMSLGALSGTQTPLAAVAGGSPFANGWSDSGIGPASRMRLEKPSRQQQQKQQLEVDVDSASQPSTAPHPTTANKDNPNNGPDDPIIPSPGTSPHLGDPPSSATHPHNQPPPPPQIPFRPPPRMRERKPEDFQVLCHAKYAGDIRLSLTAEILLDYPMPSFVGLPLKLNVTGITFDGVAVIAYIRKRVHFCFLSAEDADALLGSEEQQKQGDNSNPAASNANNSAGLGLDAHNITSSAQKRQGGLLQEIRVESEIGRKEDGKQVLKNVGKVERFVLAQVRRIFEEELVFPSFWTFLV